MRKTTTLLLAVGCAAVVGCGNSGKYANKPSPPQPINLTVYINNSKVSVSPASIGAGPAVFTVTNRASQAESLTILPVGASAGQALADTGPINPQGTAEVQVNFSTQGDYSIGAASTGSGGDAAATTTQQIQPATIHVGKARSGGSTQLLTP
jgi:hypothetical protein